MSIRLPIEPEKLQERSIKDRFWGSDPKQHYFARAKNVVLSPSFDAALIAQIEHEYGRDLAADFADEWHQLLEDIVFHIARDGHIDRDEQAFFRQFIGVFRIPDDTAKEVYKKGARRAYIAIAQQLARDGRFDQQDSASLSKVAKHFGLSEHEQAQSLKQSLSAIINARLNDIISDRMISDAEWADLMELCDGLGIHLQLSQRDQGLVDQARMRWRVMYGELLPIEVRDVKLKGDELAYMRSPADWLETRKVEGVDTHVIIASGTTILTNQRILFFVPGGNNKSYAWGELLSVRIHSPDEFELERSRGKSPIVAVNTASSAYPGLSAKLAARLFHAG